MIELATSIFALVIAIAVFIYVVDPLTYLKEIWYRRKLKRKYDLSYPHIDWIKEIENGITCPKCRMTYTKDNCNIHPITNDSVTCECGHTWGIK